ncbi:MAG: hypothetical protein ABIL24_07040 [candidate division WOR-3 bacterium]
MFKEILNIVQSYIDLLKTIITNNNGFLGKIILLFMIILSIFAFILGFVLAIILGIYLILLLMKTLNSGLNFITGIILKTGAK